MNVRKYDAARDRDAAARIHRECGWLDEARPEIIDAFTGTGTALVADLNDEAEALTTTASGTMRYLEEDLPFCCVTGVATSRIARRQGLAGRTTAAALAADAAQGALVAALGVFDQGYYDRLGFGTGGYGHSVDFDPAQLKLDLRPRVPQRFGLDDWERLHASRVARLKGHGSCTLDAPRLTWVEMQWRKDGFGLGYSDDPHGEPTHHFCCAPEGEAGPYHIHWLVYRTREQFLELMALLKSLADQVRLVKMCEPPGIQLVDLLERPRSHEVARRSTRYATGLRAFAWWQARMCDVVGCLARTRLDGPEARFNLTLSDPLEAYLDGDAPWRGVGGEYVLTLGPSSAAERGSDASLPTLTASVGAFTRLWLGVRSASGLAVTDELSASPELLAQLDRTLRLPQPTPDWDF
jgi:hypothetical protein